MTLFAIYDHPSDYPDFFVVRKWLVLPNREPVPEALVFRGETLEDAREFVRGRAACRFPRHPKDDPVIVEAWL